VRGELGLSSSSCFGHELAHVGSRDLVLVLALLSVLPVLFPLSLLVGYFLVLSLDVLKVILLFHSHIVLKHASHSGHVFSLLGILFVLSGFVVGVPLMLSLLLLDPVFLGSLVLLKPEAISCIDW